MEKGTIKHLPEELIAEILYNLPVKSLSRFKSVSKPWHSLISSKHFVEEHLKRCNSNPAFAAHHKLFVGRDHAYTADPKLRSCPLASFLDENPTVVSNWDYHHHPTVDGVPPERKILGSCNGVFLIAINKNIHLWNPSTRTLKKIPLSSCPNGRRAGDCLGNLVAGTSKLHRLHDYFLYGFGYDDSTDDYKIVWIINYSVPNYLEIRQTKIYSFRNDSWKTIENFVDRFQGYNQGKFVNGKLHWLGLKDNAWSIVSLDLAADEEFRVVGPPPFRFNKNVASLWNLGGCLGVMDTRDMDMSVWVMTEYGDAESWSKIWSLSEFVFDAERMLATTFVTPIWLTKNGDIFVAFGKFKVGVYNGGKMLREYRIGDEAANSFDFGGYEPIVYVESLV